MMSILKMWTLYFGNDNVNPIERELSNVIGNSESICDDDSNSHPRENDFGQNGFGNHVPENIIPRQDRLQETMEIFTSEFNMRLFQERDSMMSMIHNQKYRAISTAIVERVFPEIQNTISSMLSSGNQDTEASPSPNSQESIEWYNGFKTKITEKDSRSACDLSATRDNSPRGFHRSLKGLFLIR